MSEFVERSAPTVDELVIGLVKRVEKYGVYLDLLDYPGWEGFVHVSEISLKWIRNIRDYLKEGQRDVFRVLRIDPATRQADVSYRRVSQKEREDKMRFWKRKQRLLRILKLLSERSGRSEEELKRLIVEPALKRGLSLYDVLLESLEEEKLPEWMELDEGLAKLLMEIIGQEIKIREVTVQGVLVMSVPRGDGVEVIRRAVSRGLEAARKEDVLITTIGSPRYLISVRAEDAESGRKVIEKVAEACLAVIREAGGKGELQLK
ncbi:MAG: S1 RNA-binding domain-containing protein [Nitrososphaerota archaeon]